MSGSTLGRRRDAGSIPGTPAASLVPRFAPCSRCRENWPLSPNPIAAPCWGVSRRVSACTEGATWSNQRLGAGGAHC